jgi:hypothetical protein
MIYTSQHLKQLRKVQGNTFKKRVQYQLKNQKLYKVDKWIYSTLPTNLLHRKDYIAIGSRIYTPSYLSLETVLYKAGMIFQYSSALTYMWPYTITKTIQSQIFEYKRLPINLLVWNVGLIRTPHGYQATPERALCDILYHNIHYPIDIIPHTLDKELLIKISEYYSHTRWQKSLPTRILSLLP